LSSNTGAKTSWQKHPLLFAKVHSLAAHMHQKAHKTLLTKEGRVRMLENNVRTFLELLRERGQSIFYSYPFKIKYKHLLRVFF